MSLFNRLKYRIKDEGLFLTVKYIIFVIYYCLREFLYNTFLDLRYSRKLLRGNIKTSYKQLGSNDIYHTKYSVLPLIFKMVPISKDDVLVDVGCGKGRVINYWLSRNYKNKIIGLELDKEIAKQTANQLSRWKNVSIIEGNAIHNIPKDGTIFYFYNPFSVEIVKQFEETLAKMFQNKPIIIIYYNPKSIQVFQNSKWQIKYINFEKDLAYKQWGRINKYHELAIIKKNCCNNGAPSRHEYK